MYKEIIKINHRFHRFSQIKRLRFKNPCHLCNLWFQFFVLTLALTLIASQSESKPSHSRLKTSLRTPILPFILNNGQVDREISFYTKTSKGDVLVTKEGEIVYALPSSEKKEVEKMRSYEVEKNLLTSQPLNFLTSEVKGVALKEYLIGARVKEPKGEDRADTKVNYFIGNEQSKWRSNIPTYDTVNLGEVYRGIEVKLKAYGEKVEKLFYLKPGANLKDLKIGLNGAKVLRVNDTGELEIDTGYGVIKFTRPVAYQIKGQGVRSKKQFDTDTNTDTKRQGARQYVEVAYVVNPPNPPLSKGVGGFYGFKVGEYDKTKELIIDPLLASTFVGGSDNDSADTIAIDSSGNVYIAGKTTSSNYPAYGYDTSQNNREDVFVSKFNSDLTTLISSTFIGGSYNDFANAIAIDSSGNVYIAGKTTSSDYPTTLGSYDTSYNSEDFTTGDVFVSRLSNDLTSLLSSTYVGWDKEDYASSIAIDSSGNILITGGTNSSDYPTTSGSYDTSHNGSYDVFVSRLNSELTSLLSSTYVGWDKEDYASSIAIDSSGNILITGGTNSSDYPTTSGSYDTSHNGSYDVFVSKLSSDLTSLLSSTFVGGSNLDVASAIIITSDGIYITGGTYSSNYPTISGYYDISHNDSYDVFISRFSSDLTSLLSSTFVGGSNDDFANTITADSSGNIYIAGFTGSSDYPTTTGSYDPSHNGGNDVFISKLNSTLVNLLSSTFIGGSGSEIAYGMAISSDNIYIAGETNSSNYPTTSGAYDELYTSSYDVFISKLDIDISSLPYTLTVTTSGTGGGNVTSSSAAINCGSDCSEAYVSGISVTLTAAADSSSVFTGWGGGCSGTSSTCTITIDANTSVTANFDKATYTLTVTISGTGSGTVTSSPAGINCGLDCSEAYVSGTSVTLTAVADSGSVFAGWGDRCSGTDTCTITINANTSVVTAKFNKTPSSDGGNGGQGGQCIVISIYGSDLHPHVKKLREFRDKWLISNFKFTRPTFVGSPNSKIEIPNIIGKAVVKFYYKVSPRTAGYIRRYNSLKILARWMFTPLIYGISYT
jgi:uncharacterized repeat protein (TIGR02543 family)